MVCPVSIRISLIKIMALLQRFRQSFRRLQWKLTFSYTTVTVGALSLAVLILGFILFSTILAPHELIPPKMWINLVRDQIPSYWRYVLSHEPIDTHLVNMMVKEGFGEQSDFQVSFIDLLRVGDLQLTARMMGQANILIIDPEGVLLGTSNPAWVSEESVGKHVDPTILPGLDVLMSAALSGKDDPEQLFVDIVPHEEFYFTVPVYADPESSREVLAVGVIYVVSLPTENDLLSNSMYLLIRSAIIFLLAAGIIGTIFGYLTAQGMTRRLRRIAGTIEAWSQGDFRDSIADTDGDEISQLSTNLNHMAEQLEGFFKRSKDMAIAEERNKLARDLHDSAKQEALAASFHLGTARTLIDQDKNSAKKHLVEAEHLVDSVREELAELIQELRPTSNDENFRDAINDYLLNWVHQAGIKATLDLNVENDLEPPPAVKQSVNRIIQEALANVRRHSSADEVVVALHAGKNSLELSISDNGIGFDPQMQYGGIGLESMRERAESLNGEFSLESRPGRGTKIYVMLPMK
jgi:NarL family two-component system sensor histidine kinase LiaS